MAIAADMRFGHYHVLAPLGAGGMGEVWRARDTRLNREVAIKVLPREYSADADRLRRFEQEALAVSALNHPNILTIYDIGTHEGAPFIVAELLEGEELRAQLEPGALPVRRALEYAQQITQGLAAAHEKGIVHRDLKPENLFVTKDGRVKILDFGLAKLKPQQVGAVDIDAPTQKKITDPGTVLGTVGYMSPEQVRGQEADTRADIFSFGVILYEMLSGRRTFSGDSAIEVMNAILKEDPPELTATNTRVPQGLERLIRRCLEKKPEHRFHSAHDLGYALEALSSLSLNQGLDTAKVMSAPSAEISPARTTSSARIILGEIKPHKFAALIALLLMIVAAVGLGLYLRGQKTEVAIDSIAVLPFVNQNRAEETEYLADGLTESIINNLARLPDLRVIARNSVFRFKGKEADLLGAGQALGVRAVVVGRVLQRGENLMVSAELVDVRENKQLWGQQYNRKLADVFAVQEDIAKEISEKLRVKLSGAERQQLAKRPTENLKAFGYYMQGRAYFHRSTREDNLTAIRYYEKAIEEDRNYALAYAGLAGTYLVLGSRGQIAPIESRRKGEENARKALALDDNLAEGHAVRGQVYIEFSPSNFSLGDREQRRAIELSPNLAIAHLYLAISLVRQGRIDESLAEYMKARELDPLSSITVRDLALPYYLKRDYARALELLRQANELGPAFSTTFEIGVYIQNRLFNEALAELEKAKRERKDDPILIYDTGMVYAARGERAEALRIIKELETMSGASMSQAHWIAKIYATLNEKEMAFSWLERGLVAGAIGAFYKDEPVWDPIRSDPRFGDLLRRMGVPQ